MHMKKTFLLLSALLFLGAACTPTTKTTLQMNLSDSEKMMQEENIHTDEKMKFINDEVTQEIKKMSFDFAGALIDVRGEQTTGLAQARYRDGEYSLLASFKDLEEPSGTDFYEGWIVRRGSNMSVISTGRVEKVDGAYTNTYISEQDLTDHDFYVLTLEPDDGDPAPAAHIAEGAMTKRE